MNENKSSNSLSVKELPNKDIAAISTENTNILEDVRSSAAWSTEDDGDNYIHISMKTLFNAIKTYILSSEDDIAIQCSSRDFYSRDREPMFVIVDSNIDSPPSSKEMLFDDITTRPTNKINNKKIQPIDIPCTSTDTPQYNVSEELDNMEELLMMDINLQSDNEITVDDEIDNNSIVMSYLRNKNLPMSFEEYSETSLDVHIPSYPGSPRSLERNIGQSLTSTISEISSDYRTPKLQKAVDFLHAESEFLEAAKAGDVKKLEDLINKGTDIQETDPIGRNALHLAICSGSKKAVSVLLKAGVNPNLKDNVGQTPLSLCLWRCPSVTLLKLLFKRGAIIFPRHNVMDTGLFLQFILMCTPTRREEEIIYLLVQQGALVNDPDAPGGRQALHLAAMSNNCALISILYALGANIYLTNNDNQTAKEFALMFKCREAYALLEELEDKFVESVSLVSGKSVNEGFRNTSFLNIKGDGSSPSP